MGQATPVPFAGGPWPSKPRTRLRGPAVHGRKDKGRTTVLQPLRGWATEQDLSPTFDKSSCEGDNPRVQPSFEGAAPYD